MGHKLAAGSRTFWRESLTCSECGGGSGRESSKCQCRVLSLTPLHLALRLRPASWVESGTARKIAAVARRRAGVLSAVLKRLDLRAHGSDSGDDLADLLPRPQMGDAVPAEAVRELVAQVRDGGDAAIRELAARFDGVEAASSLIPPE